MFPRHGCKRPLRVRPYLAARIPALLSSKQRVGPHARQEATQAAGRRKPDRRRLRRPPSLSSEKDWAEKTLPPTLEKAPEKPIGAPTGINLDEHGHARFTTISGVPIRRLYTQADLPEDWSSEKYLGYPGQPPYTRGIHATGYRGKLCTMRQFSGFASPEETNQRYKYLLEQRRQWALRRLRSAHADGLRLRSSRQRRRSRQVRRGHRLARRHGNPLRRHRPREDHRLHDHQFAGVGPVGHVSGGCRKTGRRLEENLRHASERHPQGIHRAEGIHLSAGAFDAPGGRHLRVRRAIHARSSTPFRSADTTFAKPARPPSRNWRSPFTTASSTWNGR